VPTAAPGTPSTVTVAMGDVRTAQGAQEAAPRMARVPALDGLRGAAVVAVLFFHAGHLTGGYLGVDLFFVLSGYLITSLLVLEWRSEGHLSLGAFWGRRARRLLPALFAVLFAVGVAAHWEVLPGARGQLRSAGLATMAYVANWHAIWSGNGYWDRVVQPSWLEHTWSLAIEEQFYLVWPLVALVVLRTATRAAGPVDTEVANRLTRRLGVVALAGVALSAALMIGGSLAGFSTERLYLGTDTRMAAILLGAWAACRQHGGRPVPEGSARRLLTGGSVVALGVLVLAWTRLEGTSVHLYRGGLFACGLAAMVIILDVSTPGASYARPVLSLTPLRWLGFISYGLYLWHWPIFQFLYPGRYGLTGWELTAVRIGVSIGVATVSFFALERPILERRWPVRLGPMVPVGIAVAGLALVLGTSGAVDPVPRTGTGTASVLRAGGHEPTVMVVGDSVAYDLAEDGLIPAANAGAKLRVVDRANIGCTIMRDIDDPMDAAIRNCSPTWPADVRQVKPDVVMLLIGGYAGVVPVPVDGEQVWPCEPAFDRKWRRRLDDAVDVLGAGGARVVLVTAPTAAMPVMKGPHPDLFDARQKCTNVVVEDVAASRSNVKLVDLAHWTCPTWPDCRAEVDGVVLRPDGVHFHDKGAAVVAGWMVPQLIRAAQH